MKIIYIYMLWKTLLKAKAVPQHAMKALGGEEV
jgi:hypothetical protein